jgi:hypothetical protein
MTEDTLLVWSEEAVAPGDRLAHRALSRRSVARASLEDRKAVLKSIAQCRQGERADPRRSQFKGERQPVEFAADLGHGLECVIRGRKPRIHRARPFDEKLHGRVFRQIQGLTKVQGR